MTKQELDNLKYKIYKKSGLSDYITYKQFLQNDRVAYTFSELNKRKQKKKNQKKIGKNVKKDLKKEKK